MQDQMTSGALESRPPVTQTHVLKCSLLRLRLDLNVLTMGVRLLISIIQWRKKAVSNRQFKTYLIIDNYIYKRGRWVGMVYSSGVATVNHPPSVRVRWTCLVENQERFTPYIRSLTLCNTEETDIESSENNNMWIDDRWSQRWTRDMTCMGLEQHKSRIDLKWKVSSGGGFILRSRHISDEAFDLIVCYWVRLDPWGSVSKDTQCSWLAARERPPCYTRQLAVILFMSRPSRLSTFWTVNEKLAWGSSRMEALARQSRSRVNAVQITVLYTNNISTRHVDSVDVMVGSPLFTLLTPRVKKINQPDCVGLIPSCARFYSLVQ